MDGEWYLSGCRKDDPSRLRTAGDIVSRVKRDGFLTLFASAVPGFSVEEHTWAHDWWSDDPGRDPWIWRQVIAEDEDIAYGKFFDRKAGFISREWFPVFANFRREMMSGELRKRAAVEKGFDNVLIDLQMQTFLLISRFGQKRNKRGEEYGWHLPFFMTPETKWGYSAVNSCNEKPEVSRERLKEQIRKICPAASENEIRKILGIRK